VKRGQVQDDPHVGTQVVALQVEAFGTENPDALPLAGVEERHSILASDQPLGTPPDNLDANSTSDVNCTGWVLGHRSEYRQSDHRTRPASCALGRHAGMTKPSGRGVSSEGGET
jgi:hypothetical protein